MSDSGTGRDDAGRNELLRSIPKVSEMLARPDVERLSSDYGQGATKAALRAVLSDLRKGILSGQATRVPSPDDLVSVLEAGLVRVSRPEGRKAINATGIVLHTGLGRAPLCREALEALAGMGHYSILQTSVETGARSRRDEKIESLLVELTGCEAATVVNNNAAATMLILNALAEGGEVVISRSQLVEIGGSFRLPDVMAKSGCILREVGTTNRTHLRDYANAIGERTGAILHVHTSNYRIRGFHSTPETAELVALAREHGLPVIDDLGSGALVPLRPYGVPDEPLVRASMEAGADVACFSADKLICGPQSGVIVGRREIVERIRKNPYARMFRTSKLELAALEATLLHFMNGTHEKSLPLYRMLAQDVAELEARAAALISAIGELDGAECKIQDDLSYVGSGSAPDEGMPTKAVRIVSGKPAELIARDLRCAVPSVFGRISDGSVLLDMRTVREDEVDTLARTVREVLAT